MKGLLPMRTAECAIGGMRHKHSIGELGYFVQAHQKRFAEREGEACYQERCFSFLPPQHSIEGLSPNSSLVSTNLSDRTGL